MTDYRYKLKNAFSFVDEVKKNPEDYCVHIQNAIARFEKDLTRTDIYFNRDEASKWLNRASYFCHTGGSVAKQPFNLQPWQAFCIANIFGWKRANGFRRFTKFYLDIARKNGKTELIALIMSMVFCFSKEFRGEFFVAATKKDQAKITFDSARIMLKQMLPQSKHLSKHINVRTYDVLFPLLESRLWYEGADHSTMDGLNPFVGTIDEFHAHKTSRVLDVVESGQGSRDEPLLLITTTAGFNHNGPCKPFREQCFNILRGTYEADHIFPMIFTLDEEEIEEGWGNEKCWKKSNPNLDVSIKLDYLRDQYKEADQLQGSKLVSFKTKNLNIWVASNDTWVTDKIWEQNGDRFDLEEMTGLPCYVGIDLASKHDLCSVCLFFPSEGRNPHHLYWYHFCNTETIDKRSTIDSVPYRDWTDQGLITETPGNTTDYDAITEMLLDIHYKFDVKGTFYDPYESAQLINKLRTQGIQCEQMAQTIRNFSYPTEMFEKTLIDREMNHGNNPLMRWQMSNVGLYYMADRYKPHKMNSRDKIDGVMAALMAYAGWLYDEWGAHDGKFVHFE